MDEKSCEIFNLFSLLRKLNGLNKQRVESFGLNNLESIILFHIDKISNLTQKDLVDKLQVPKQTINSLILNLKENNLIDMKSSSEDKRIKILVLTDEGRKEVMKMTESLRQSNNKIYDKLGEDKVKEIQANINDLIDAIEENIKKGDI